MNNKRCDDGWQVVARDGRAWITVYRGNENAARREAADRASRDGADAVRLYDPSGRRVAVSAPRQAGGR